MSDRIMKLLIESPYSAGKTCECDSLHLPLTDGSYGVRPGRARAVIALGKGDVIAYREGEEIYRESISGGFAGVFGSIVRIVKI